MKKSAIASILVGMSILACSTCFASQNDDIKEASTIRPEKPLEEVINSSPLHPSDFAKSIPSMDYRAISFPTNAGHAVGGKLRKGDAVDIIVTINNDPSAQNITKTIFQGIPVFDVTGHDETISSVTLLVTIEQAEKIKHAYGIGDVSYSLNPAHPVMKRTHGVTDKEFLASFYYTKNV